jgi:hypothetical protein
MGLLSNMIEMVGNVETVMNGYKDTHFAQKVVIP